MRPCALIKPSSHEQSVLTQLNSIYWLCRERVPALLNKLRLSHGGVEVHGTPRRLTVLIHDLAAAQTPQESKVWFYAVIGLLLFLSRPAEIGSLWLVAIC